MTLASFNPMVQDAAGRYGFECRMTGPGVTFDNDRVLWVGTPGNWSVIAREGEAAPGTAVGVIFNSLVHVELTPGGRIVFTGGVTGPGVATGTNGLWAGMLGDVQLDRTGGNTGARNTRGNELLVVNRLEGERQRAGGDLLETHGS